MSTHITQSASTGRMSVPELLSSAKRIVIKVGSSLLLDDSNSEDPLRREWLNLLASDIARLNAQGKEVIVVSSGAIGLGWARLGYKSRPSRLDQRQASAAAGQIELAAAWSNVLAARSLNAAQILLTLQDLENRTSYLNARGKLRALIEQGAIAIINENDTTATTETRFGDNDRLAARVAGLVGAEVLLLLSDVDGLYTAPPGTKGAEHIPYVGLIDERIEALAGPSAAGSPGSGGMVTKIQAAQIAVEGGTHMLIASGRVMAPITALLEGALATIFAAQDDPHTKRKSWLRGMMAPQGKLHLDQGAVKALYSGASLLSAGVTRTEGRYDEGALVALISPSGAIIAQGLVAYPSYEVQKICGLPSKDIEAAVGHDARSALVHRDDLVMLTPLDKLAPPKATGADETPLAS